MPICQNTTQIHPKYAKNGEPRYKFDILFYFTFGKQSYPQRATAVINPLN
jgi:hypothetical protein